MMVIDVYLTIGYPGADHKDELEVEDDATDDQIDQEVSEWAHNYIEFGWSRK